MSRPPSRVCCEKSNIASKILEDAGDEFFELTSVQIEELLWVFREVGLPYLLVNVRKNEPLLFVGYD